MRLFDKIKFSVQEIEDYEKDFEKLPSEQRDNSDSGYEWLVSKLNHSLYNKMKACNSVKKDTTDGTI